MKPKRCSLCALKALYVATVRHSEAKERRETVNIQQQETFRRWGMGEGNPTDAEMEELDELVPDNIARLVSEAKLDDEDARQVLVMGAFLATHTAPPSAKARKDGAE